MHDPYVISTWCESYTTIAQAIEFVVFIGGLGVSSVGCGLVLLMVTRWEGLVSLASKHHSCHNMK